MITHFAISQLAILTPPGTVSLRGTAPGAPKLQTVIPTNANTFSFVFSPILTLFLSLFGWAVIPFSFTSFFASIDVGLVFLLVVSSLGVYGVILSG